jgi:hypothetical protein
MAAVQGAPASLPNRTFRQTRLVTEMSGEQSDCFRPRGMRSDIRPKVQLAHQSPAQTPAFCISYAIDCFGLGGSCVKT